MRYTWDPAKSARNELDRGPSFAGAALLWDAPMLVRIDARREYGETRRIGFGVIGERVMVVGWVLRDGDVVHIFTFRKANAREARRYREFVARQAAGSGDGT